MSAGHDSERGVGPVDHANEAEVDAELFCIETWLGWGRIERMSNRAIVANTKADLRSVGEHYAVPGRARSRRSLRGLELNRIAGAPGKYIATTQTLDNTPLGVLSIYAASRR